MASTSSSAFTSHSQSTSRKASGPQNRFNISADRNLPDADYMANLLKHNVVPMFGDEKGMEAFLSALEFNPRNGIDDDESVLDCRRKSHGANEFCQPNEKPFYQFVFEALNEFTMLVLLAGAVAALLLGILFDGIKKGWYDGGSILIAFLLVLSICAFTNFYQAKQFTGLLKFQNEMSVRVRRSSAVKEVLVREVVVGDLVVLQTGCMVPANGILFKNSELELDRSITTGQSSLVKVRDESPYLLAGDIVGRGCGEMVVLSVGNRTEYGKIMAFVNRKAEKQTPLLVRLEILAKQIGKIAFTVAGVLLVALLVRYFTGKTMDEGLDSFSAGKTRIQKVLTCLVKIVSVAVAIVVITVPKGLPLAVTLALAFSLKDMMKERAFVRNLSSCETMGAATTICTDKTGTLTTGNMTVEKISIGANLQHNLLEVTDKMNKLLLDAIVWNTDARFVSDLVTDDGSQRNNVTDFRININDSHGVLCASPTETALLEWSLMNNSYPCAFRAALNNHERVLQEPFDSDRKTSGVVVVDETKRYHVHLKGAVEKVLHMSNSVYLSDDVVLLTEDRRKLISNRIEQYAGDGLRCIGFAHQLFQSGDGLPQHFKFENDRYTFIGIFAIRDEIRKGVVEVVRKLKEAGVTVRMVTGDNLLTAKATSIKCEILTGNEGIDDQSIISGDDWRSLSELDQEEKCERIRVMARALPEDKLKLVRALQKKNNVVAVTGDGTNDAQALKEADVGLSMGVRGTEAAKQASDIVILDDNFTTVVTVLKWGRGVENNMKKFIQFQLTVTIAAIILNFINVVYSGKVALSAIQLLWVNLVINSFGALALATEAPSDQLLQKAPSAGRTAPIISRIMWRHMISQSLFQVIVLLILEFQGKSIFSVEVDVTKSIIFNTFVFCQVCNQFNARQLGDKNIFKGLAANKWFALVIGFTVVLQAVLMEFLNKFAGIVKLTTFQKFICIFIALFSWIIAFVINFVPVIHINFEI